MFGDHLRGETPHDGGAFGLLLCGMPQAFAEVGDVRELDQGRHCVAERTLPGAAVEALVDFGTDVFEARIRERPVRLELDKVVREVDGAIEDAGLARIP